MSADAIDKDEQLKTLKTMLEETIDVHQEAQELNNLFTHVHPSFHPRINAQPGFKDFTHSMQSARDRNVRILHLAGHDDRKCGFLWLKKSKKKSSAASTEYEEIPMDKLSSILETEAAANGGTIECVVLNACETEEMGKKLRRAGVHLVVCWRSEVQDTTAKKFALDFYSCLDQQEQGQGYGHAFEQAVARMDSEEMGKRLRSAGVSHVVCWRSEVQDDTAREFALQFYASLDEQDPTREYSRAFQHAVARIGSGGGDARAKAEHLDAGAVDYVCLLSESGDLFPDTGRIRQGDCLTRNWRTPKDATDFAAWAGQAEKEVLRALEFKLLLKGKEIGQLEITVPGGAQAGSLVRFEWPRVKGHVYDVVVPDGAFDGMQFMTEVPPPSGRFAKQKDSQMLAESRQADTGKSLHGLTGGGYFTEDALRALDIDNYSDLWGESGKVVEKARELLLSEAHSTTAHAQVRKAYCELEQAVYFRQLDIMAHRLNATGKEELLIGTKAAEQNQGKHKERILQEHKETLLSSKKNEILEKYCGDRRDRELIRDGKTAQITVEQPAEAEAVHVAMKPAPERYDMNANYRTLLNKKGVRALEEASGATIKIEIKTSTKGYTKGQKVGNIVIEGPTKKSQDVAWKLITRQRELDSDCEKMGFKWIKVGTTRPPEGRERVDKGLETALMTTSELTEEEFGNLRIRDLRGDDFIMLDSYFKPAVCGKCDNCSLATHFLHLDKVCEAKEKLHALVSDMQR